MSKDRNVDHVTAMRQRIDSGRLVKRLFDHAFGEVPMEKTQITAAIALLRKTLPDLQSIEMDVSGKIDIDSLSTETLIEQANAIIRKSNVSANHISH